MPSCCVPLYRLFKDINMNIDLLILDEAVDQDIAALLEATEPEHNIDCSCLWFQPGKTINFYEELNNANNVRTNRSPREMGSKY